MEDGAAYLLARFVDIRAGFGDWDSEKGDAIRQGRGIIDTAIHEGNAFIYTYYIIPFIEGFGLFRCRPISGENSDQRRLLPQCGRKRVNDARRLLTNDSIEDISRNPHRSEIRLT